MDLRFEILAEKKLLGHKMILSMNNERTRELWQGFMPAKNEIKNSIGNDLFSVSIYPPNYFDSFNPDNTFEKWAAIEVKDFKHVPVNMQTLIIPSGLYAVFLYKGAAGDGAKVFGYIFRSWFPASDYLPDNRPHFEILGAKYNNDSPTSEEEIWIPVKKK
jgi:AraC family transcriptional regulator